MHKELMEKYSKRGGSLQRTLMNEYGVGTKDTAILCAILYEATVANEQNEKIIALLEKIAGEKEVSKPSKKTEKK